MLYFTKVEMLGDITMKKNIQITQELHNHHRAEELQ